MLLDPVEEMRTRWVSHPLLEEQDRRMRGKQHIAGCLTTPHEERHPMDTARAFHPGGALPAVSYERIRRVKPGHLTPASIRRHRTGKPNPCCCLRRVRRRLLAHQGKPAGITVSYEADRSSTSRRRDGFPNDLHDPIHLRLSDDQGRGQADRVPNRVVAALSGADP